jgi:hypothetical protein
MTQQIILNGTVPNDGTGDNLYVAANKINDNFTELYNRIGLTGTPDSINLESTGTGGFTAGTTGSGSSNFGNTGSGTSSFGNGGSSTGNSSFGNAGSNTGTSSFGNGSGTTGSSGFGNAGSGSSGFGNSGAGASNHGNSGSGNSNFGNSGNGNSTFGNTGTGTNTYITSEDPWQVLFSNGSKQIDSSEWLKVSADSADVSGKSLHLGASTYDLGFGNSLKQRAIYFTDPSITGSEAVAFPTKRVASIRWYDNSAFGKGLFLSPDYNYNDTAFPNRGVGIWRHIENGITNTKVNLNAECDGPGTHGVQIGRGAIAFFQDIPAYAIPEQREEAVKGKTYIVLPGIHTDDGSVHVGQVSSNPYKNRESESKGIPYWSLGHKPSTQLIENSPAGGIEKSERTPGSEVIVWTIQNRVGINNTNPAYDLDVTGSVNLTGQFLVDASAGTAGQVLTSNGASSSPTWAAVSLSTATNLSGGGTGSIPYQSSAGNTAMLSAGTNGQVLKMGGSGVPVWGTDDGAVSVSDDDTGNTDYNLLMTTATSGTVSTVTVDGGDIKYNPSTGTLTTPNLLVSASGVDFTGAANALYFNSGDNRVTLANYNAGGTLVFETNGGAQTAIFLSNGTYQFLNLYATAVSATPRQLYVDSTGIIGYVSSTRESKTNIETIDNVDWISNLNPVSFNRRKKDADGNYSNEAYTEKVYGLIAEEVEQVNPDLCMYDGDKLVGINYDQLVAPLLKKIQELETRLAAVENKND